MSEPPPSSLFRDLKDAVRGTAADYTDGPIGRAILLLAVPMVLEMGMESLFALTDIFWVSKLGAAETAAVGLTESLLTVVYALAVGLSIGVTALVSRRIGEKRPEDAASGAVQAIWLGILVAVILGAVGVWKARDLLRLMGAEPAVIEAGLGYTRVMLGGEATVILLFLINAAFRGAGDASRAMRVVWIANGINIVLDPLLIFGLGPIAGLGVTGAAIATTVGRGIGVLLQLRSLGWHEGRLQVRRDQVRLDLGVMGRIVRLSATGTLQTMVGMLSWIVLVRVLAGFGAAALAGYTIAIRLVIFALLPSWGLSNAAATMVGQGLGAGKPERAERSVWLAGRYNAYFLGAVGLVFVALAGPIVRVFTDEPEVVRHAVRCLWIVSLGFPLYAYGMVLTQSFNGAGDAWTPTWLNLACFWALELPLAWWLAHGAGLGPTGPFVAITAAFSSLALGSALVFRRGRWKASAV